MSDQRYCTSCGRPIPDGHGSSCSMCYGDLDYGRDGYAREAWEADQERYAYEQQAEEVSDEQG